MTIAPLLLAVALGIASITQVKAAHTAFRLRRQGIAWLHTLVAVIGLGVTVATALMATGQVPPL